MMISVLMFSDFRSVLQILLMVILGLDVVYGFQTESRTTRHSMLIMNNNVRLFQNFLS